MALKHQAEIHVARIYSPLTLSPGITVEGNVPALQTYDIATGLYEPDYTATHLRLHAALDIVDPDGELPDGEAQLTNISWTLYENGAETSITASTPGFSVDASGDLTVKRNCSGIEPMTLRFKAEFLDTRTGS